MHDIIIIRYSFMYTRVHVGFVVSSDCYRISMIIVVPIATLSLCYPLKVLFPADLHKYTNSYCPQIVLPCSTDLCNDWGGGEYRL